MAKSDPSISISVPNPFPGIRPTTENSGVTIVSPALRFVLKLARTAGQFRSEGAKGKLCARVTSFYLVYFLPGKLTVRVRDGKRDSESELGLLSSALFEFASCTKRFHGLLLQAPRSKQYVGNRETNIDSCYEQLDGF